MLEWGNGLKLIADELKDYPGIDFQWKEVGLSFQVQFIKRDFRAELEARKELGQELGQELRQERSEKTLFILILEELVPKPASRKEIMVALGMKTASGYLNRTLIRLQALDLIGQTLPEIPNHPHQKFQISDKGKTFLKLVKD